MSMPREPYPAGVTGDTEILRQDRPPLAPVMDGVARPRPEDRMDAAGWRKIDPGVSEAQGWASIDDAADQPAPWRQV